MFGPRFRAAGDADVEILKVLSDLGVAICQLVIQPDREFRPDLCVDCLRHSSLS